MKTIEIIIDGKTYQAQMSVDEVKKLAEKPIRTGYERADNRKQHYYYSDTVGEIGVTVECQNSVDNKRYNTANHCTDKTLAENNARADELMRQLRRFAVEENAKAGIALDWEDKTRGKFNLSFVCGRVQVDCMHYTKNFGQIYFATVENAKKAIDTFRDELLWYFTEYKDYYVEGENHD